MRDQSLPALRALAETILRNATAFQWTLQGFGMLRLHMPGEVRLHVWDQRYRVPGVSDVHDHLQWGLRSTVVAGSLDNRLYVEASEDVDGATAFNQVTLKPGVGTHFKDEARSVWLRSEDRWVRTLKAGDSYYQAPRQIHSSHPIDGTVTVMQKYPTGDESARVFWPSGADWVSAEPRNASPEIVADICTRSLHLWFGEPLQLVESNLSDLCATPAALLAHVSDERREIYRCAQAGCSQTDGAPCDYPRCPQRGAQG